MSPFVKVFLVVWFAGVVSLGGLLIVSELAAVIAGPRAASSDDWMAIVLPAIMLMAGIGMVRFGRYLARNERDEILSILCDTLQATRRAQNID